MILRNKRKTNYVSAWGGKCSNPNCRKETKGPHSDPRKSVSIGVAAHITAASEGGPRYDPNMSSEERRSIENGIWLCSTCAKMIDSDADAYPAELLHEWKKVAEDEQIRIINQGEIFLTKKAKNPPLKNESVNIQQMLASFKQRKMFFY